MGAIGALPARFRRERVLVVGCGDVGLRTVKALGGGERAALLALSSRAERTGELRLAGVQALIGNLDAPATLARLAGLATRVLYLAPPPTGEGHHDPRSWALAQALARRSRPRALVYVSTTGVYGDVGGAWVNETAPVRPQTARAKRRVMAESLWRQWGRVRRVAVSVLRAPGIYAADRAGGDPKARLLRGLPVLASPDDVYSNHIHADDLAQACARALWRAPVQRVFNVCDDRPWKMGDYWDAVAQHHGLPLPTRLPRERLQQVVSPMTWSFMAESRRVDNRRLRQELGVRLRYPDAVLGLG